MKASLILENVDKYLEERREQDRSKFSPIVLTQEEKRLRQRWKKVDDWINKKDKDDLWAWRDISQVYDEN